MSKCEEGNLNGLKIVGSDGLAELNNWFGQKEKRERFRGGVRGNEMDDKGRCINV